MAYSAEEIRLTHRVVGTQHVYTSPDVPELHVSHTDKARAHAAIQSALDMLERMRQRTKPGKIAKAPEQERFCA